MDSKPSLTIAIPTYNRPKYLAETLRRLLPQINDEWILHIHDNCSEQPVSENQANLLAAFGTGRVVLFRNNVNVGIHANILRCFEHCSTKWLIILADDDLINETFVDVALKTKTQHPDIVFANFSSSIHSREASFTTNGLSEFCQKMDNWANLLFLPCGLYSAPTVMPYIRYGYQYSYSIGPHIAMLLQCLKEAQGKCLFSNDVVVEHTIPPDVVTWSRLNMNLMVILAELIPDRTSQRAFIRQMMPHFIPPARLASDLIERACANGGDAMLIFELRILCFKCMGWSLRNILLLPVLRLLVRYPKCSVKLFRMSRVIRGFKAVKNVDADLHKGQ